MRARKLASWKTGVALVGAGVASAGFLMPGRSLLGEPRGIPAADVGDAKEGSTSKVRAPKVGANGPPPAETTAEGPEDKTLTIPEMARVRDDTIPDAIGANKGALKKNAAIYLKGTGFPWQRGANVYLAGHSLGYPKTDGWLTFWDLGKFEDGDEVFLTGAAGTEQTYRMFGEFVVEPTDLSVTAPVRSVLTLRTCSLPDHSERLTVRADLVDQTPNGRERAQSASVGGRKR